LGGGALYRYRSVFAAFPWVRIPGHLVVDEIPLLIQDLRLDEQGAQVFRIPPGALEASAGSAQDLLEGRSRLGTGKIGGNGFIGHGNPSGKLRVLDDIREHSHARRI